MPQAGSVLDPGPPPPETSAMPDGTSLHDTDFLAWTRQQAAALRAAARAGSNLPVEFEQVAEEIEDIGNAQRSELRNRLTTLCEHLLKLAVSPAAAPRPGWVETVARSRLAIEAVLEESPSLRRELPRLAEAAAAGGRKLARIVLEAHGEATPDRLARIADAALTLDDHVLSDWLPPPPEA